MKINVKQDDKPVPVEVLAQSIIAIAQGVRKLRAGPLNDNALVLLIEHAAPRPSNGYRVNKVGKREIKAVLDGIDALEATYLRKRKA